MEGVPPLSTASLRSRSKTAVLVLSAGASSRMGRPKALLPYSDTETFLEHILRIYAGIGSYPIIVLSQVGGEEILGSIPASRRPLTIAFNDNLAGDRFSSAICGLSCAPVDRYVFVQDVDRPFIARTTLRSLYTHRHPAGITAPCDGGHPPLLSPYVVRELLGGTSAPTLRDALSRFDRTLVPATRSGGALNINSPEDYHTYVTRRS